MAEPVTSDVAESLPVRIERHGFDRLVTLADGVFAIAMTLLALEVRPPATWSGGVAELLAKSGRALFGYGLSFFVVGLFWFYNRTIMARIRRVDGPFTALTLLFLCLICLAPFATALVATHGPARSMKVYSILVGATGVVQVLMWVHAAFWRPLLVDAAVGRRDRWLTLFAFSVLPLNFCIAGLLVRPGTGAVAFLPVVLVAAVLGRLRRQMTRGTASPMARAGG